jgi:hypothetical protein
MNITKMIVGVLIVLIGWDVITTYFGTVAIFAGQGDGVLKTMANAGGTIHVVAIVFAVSIITFILCYKHILRGNIWFVKGILFVIFIYDFCTSIYGTASALGVSGFGYSGTLPQWAIIFILAVMATGAPLVIHQVLED